MPVRNCCETTSCWHLHLWCSRRCFYAPVGLVALGLYRHCIFYIPRNSRRQCSPTIHCWIHLRHWLVSSCLIVDVVFNIPWIHRCRCALCLSSWSRITCCRARSQQQVVLVLVPSHTYSDRNLSDVFSFRRGAACNLRNFASEWTIAPHCKRRWSHFIVLADMADRCVTGAPSA